MADYKLYYFPIRGRAELTRIMCVAAGIKFDDIRVPGSEWPEKKKSEYICMNILQILI